MDNDKIDQLVAYYNRQSRQSIDGHWYRVLNQWDAEGLNHDMNDIPLEVWQGCSSEFRSDKIQASIGVYDVWKPRANE